MIVRATLTALTLSGLLFAQQQPSPDNPPDATPPTDTHNTGPKSPQWKGLTVKEKLSYDWRHLFDVDNMVFAAVGASFDQLRDRPGKWGEGWGPFAERYGSHVRFLHRSTQRHVPGSGDRP